MYIIIDTVGVVFIIHMYNAIVCTIHTIGVVFIIHTYNTIVCIIHTIGVVLKHIQCILCIHCQVHKGTVYRRTHSIHV